MKDTNPKLIRATRRARQRWEDAHFARVEAQCAYPYDQAAAAKAADRASETYRLYNKLESRQAEAVEQRRYESAHAEFVRTHPVTGPTAFLDF
jgi:hypothetical protein